MFELDRDALDRHITDGRYTKEFFDVTCYQCGDVTRVTVESEYGAEDWDVDRCPSCTRAFDGTDGGWELV